MICAVSHVLYDAASTGSNPNANPLCGLKIRLRRNGESVDVKIVDRCVGCAETDLDVTEAVFKKVADLDQGRVSVEWSWLETTPISIS
jgi:expansin (peptidoglycan-binding protein)